MQVSEWKKDYGEFEAATKKFYAGEIPASKYKGISGGFGSYAQRGGKASMLRLRLKGGRLSKDKLKFIADSIEKYNIDKVHFTTCQTVQLHNLDGDTVCALAVEALDHGIVTRGGGGDFPRNVMVSPLSGVERGEHFDVAPYAEAAEEYLMEQAKAVKLPRKLKVCFSNSPANVTHATFRDLGFVARADGAFDVYSAGGLGNNPKMGVRVAEGVDGSKILYYIRAMIKLFVAYGNYEVRSKARTRYMQDTLGSQYAEAFAAKLEEAFQEEKLDISVKEEESAKKPDGTAAEGRRVIPQKQEGLYAVAYHPVGGCPKPGKFRELSNLIQDMEGAELRIAPDETVYIINLAGAEAEKVLAATQDGAESLFGTSVSCIGGTICQQGIRDSQGLLRKILEEVEGYKFADGVLPRIHISGCTSSCGTHQIGVIGFHGGAKRIGDASEPVFTFHVNGCEEEGSERFGEQWGVMLEREIPGFFVELGQAVQAENTTFAQWFAKDPEALRKIAEKYLH